MIFWIARKHRSLHQHDFFQDQHGALGILRPEEYPRYTNQYEGDSHLKESLQFAFGNFNAGNGFNYHEQAVQSTPDHKRPVCAMPQATYEKYNKNITIPSEFRLYPAST